VDAVTVEGPDRRAPVPGAVVAGHAVAACLVLGLALQTTEQSLPVIQPLAAAGITAGVFYLALVRWRRSASPFLEVGGAYVAVVTLYTVFPLLVFLANGLAYTRSSDNRLAAARPGPEEVGLIGWYHVLHLVVFAAAYLLARGSGGRRPRPRAVDTPTLIAAVAGYAAITGYFWFLALFFDLSASSYSESYLVAARLPLPLAQLANHLAGARFVLELVILAALFADYRRWRWVIGGWLAVLTVGAFMRLGSRTEMVLLWLAAAVMYDLMVRRLGLRRVVLPAAAGLLVFVILGFVRGGGLEKPAVYDRLLGQTEFEILFGNAFHVNRLVGAGRADPPVGATWADLLALVPQQVSPVSKVNPADWYVHTYFPDYAATGGGLAFGTIAESLLGGGLFGVVWRSVLLGLVLARFHARVAAATGRLWPMLLYVWVTVLVYQSFRATTFVLLGLLFYRFLPVALGVGLLGHMLGEIAARGPRPRVAGADAAS
jgi:hypothetical protein